MNNIINYKGTDYLLLRGRWVNAQTYLAPTKIILRELELLTCNEQNNPKEINSIRSQSNNPKRRDRIQDIVGPKIVQFVKQRFEETQYWVTRDEIREALLADEKIHTYLKSKHEQTKQCKTFFEYVGNQIDHLSARITTQTSEHTGQLVQSDEKINDCWAYRPKL